MGQNNRRMCVEVCLGVCTLLVLGPEEGGVGRAVGHGRLHCTEGRERAFS